MYVTRVLTLTAVALGFVVNSAQAVDQKAIDAAIDRGVALIQKMQGGRGGGWGFNQQGMSEGATALCALTLLECGIKANDSQIESAAAAIRDASPTMTRTYTIALSIMFLDRLGDHRDVPLIESLTVRLLAGQKPDGGWGYDCPPIAPDEVTRLQNAVKNRAELKAGPLPKGKRTSQDLPKEIKNQLQNIQQGGLQRGPMMPFPPPGPPDGNMTDNSNTQFGTLALWIGRRHGLPVDDALVKVDARYRRGQNFDGSWGYFSGQSGVGVPMVMERTGTPSMTCSALLGLAVAHGMAHDPDNKKAKGVFDPTRDAVLAKGLLALATGIGNPGGEAPRITERNRNGKAYYYLWSLERVAVAMNLETIGKKDWYAWGAEILLANQDESGGWYGEYGQNGCAADTCFALLFLRRANLLKDISANLKGRMNDPAVSTTLRGGTGAPSLSNAGKDLKSAFAREDKIDDPRKKDKPKLEPIKSKPADTEEAKLANKLVEAKGSEFKDVLKELDKETVPRYYHILAQSIPRLQGEPREQARDALGTRLGRATLANLPKYIKDVDPEIRRAAIIAANYKDSEAARSLIPLIIDRLNDGEPTVVQAAAEVLKLLTKEDFGPAVGATREEHDKAIKDWTAWWKKQGE